MQVCKIGAKKVECPYWIKQKTLRESPYCLSKCEANKNFFSKWIGGLIDSGKLIVSVFWQIKNQGNVQKLKVVFTAFGPLPLALNCHHWPFCDPFVSQRPLKTLYLRSEAKNTTSNRSQLGMGNLEIRHLSTEYVFNKYLLIFHLEICLRYLHCSNATNRIESLSWPSFEPFFHRLWRRKWTSNPSFWTIFFIGSGKRNERQIHHFGRGARFAFLFQRFGWVRWSCC